MTHIFEKGELNIPNIPPEISTEVIPEDELQRKKAEWDLINKEKISM